MIVDDCDTAPPYRRQPCEISAASGRLHLRRCDELSQSLYLKFELQLHTYRRNQQTFSINQMTRIMSLFERIESDFVAFTSFRPTWVKVTDTCPLASLVFPFTSAPATGLPVCPSVTVRITGWPIYAVPGPVSFKICALLKASNANRTSSLSLTSCCQPPTGMNWKLTSIVQNSIDVWVSPAIEVMKKSSKLVENKLYITFRAMD